jgi:hypothetical protein
MCVSDVFLDAEVEYVSRIYLSPTVFCVASDYVAAHAYVRGLSGKNPAIMYMSRTGRMALM